MFGKTVLAAVVAAVVVAPAASAGEWDHISEPPVSDSAWLAETTGPNGPWRIWAYSCWDGRIDHIALQHTWGRADLGERPPGGVCVTRDQVPDDPPEAPAITGFLTGGDAWGLIAYMGVTRDDVDLVDVRTERGWIRTNTLAPPAGAYRAGLPRRFRFYWVTVPWENNGPDGPFPLRGATAISGKRIVGCTRELSCPAGARARASKHRRVKWQRHRRGLGRRAAGGRR